MATEKHKKKNDPVSDAHKQAERDMSKDPELSDPDPTDDLDEGELAQRDNSDEKAVDYLERPRHGTHAEDNRHTGRDQQSGKGNEK